VWMRRGRNLVITGPSGVGKSFVAGALARHALTTHHTIQWQVFSSLLEALDGGSAARLKRTSAAVRSADVLVLDHFAEHQVSEVAGARLRDLLEARGSAQRPTIVVSAKPMADWDAVFSSPEIAQAVTRRVLDDAFLLPLRKAAARRPRAEHRTRGRSQTAQAAGLDRTGGRMAPEIPGEKSGPSGHRVRSKPSQQKGRR
jgi:DNA replication protein DnaC